MEEASAKLRGLTSIPPPAALAALKGLSFDALARATIFEQPESDADYEVRAGWTHAVKYHTGNSWAAISNVAMGK